VMAWSGVTDGWPRWEHVLVGYGMVWLSMAWHVRRGYNARCNLLGTYILYCFALVL
jgi:hypothetical protein